MRAEIACFTEAGELLAERIAGFLAGNPKEAFVKEGFAGSPAADSGEGPLTEGIGRFPGKEGPAGFAADQAAVTRIGRDGRLRDWTEKAFFEADALIFVGAAGIAVRAAAPHVASKATDPAVLVVDETGKYVIPLLSGHLGGANELARRLARALGAVAVVTTATDRRGVFAADAWAARHGARVLFPKRIRQISAELLAGGKILWESDFPMQGEAPAGVLPGRTGPALPEGTGPAPPGRTGSAPPEGSRMTSLEDRELSEKGQKLPAVLVTVRRSRAAGSEALVLVPRILYAGVGCRKGTSEEEILAAISGALDRADILPEALEGLYSIDAKKDEPGLLAAAKTLGLPFFTFSPEELKKAPGIFTGSAFVEKTVGVDNVCERSALLGALTRGGSGEMLLPKTVFGRVTVAAAAADFRPDFSWRTPES